jgi:predicted ATPase
MIITKLKLENIGQFENLELDFKDRVTVLVGTNSIGKTTILKSILFQTSVSVDKTGNFSSVFLGNDGRYWSNTQWLKDYFVRTLEKRDGNISIDFKYKKNNFYRNFIYKSDLFTGSEYPNGNRPLETNLTSPIFPIPIIFSSAYRKVTTKVLAYPENYNYFVNNESEITNLLTNLLYGEEENLQLWLVNRYLNKELNDQRQINEFEYFINKLNEIFPNNINLKFKGLSETYEPIFTQNDVDFPLKYLSSGLQSILFIFYQIIIRLSFFYKKDGNTKNAFLKEGIALIDEIDAHLHPEWQRMVIKSLTELFPNVQFIITSHSPLVASSCSNEQIIKLFKENNEIKAEHPKGTKGWLAEDILQEIMGVDSSRDIEVQNNINRVEELYIKKIQKNISKEEQIELEQKLYNLSELLPSTDPTLSILKYEALSKAIKGIDNA